MFRFPPNRSDSIRLRFPGALRSRRTAPARRCRPPRRYFQVLTVVLCTLAYGLSYGESVLAASTQQELSEAERYIDDLGDKTLSILLDDNTPDNEKRDALAQILGREVNFGLVSAFVLGPYLKQITPDQRSAYQALFKDFEVSNLSRRLLAYPVKSFDIVNSEYKGKSDVLVHTKIIREAHPDFVPAWRVRKSRDRYMIIDVHYEGTSLALTRRSEFQSVLDDRGIKGLMEAMKLNVEKPD